MASRVTPAEVKVIIATTLTDPVVQIWIDAANAIVTASVDCIAGDDAKLKQVELYLSSHFIALIDPDSDTSNSSIKRERVEGLDTQYSTADMVGNVNDTVYGKTANMLSNGCLINASDRPIALFSI